MILIHSSVAITVFDLIVTILAKNIYKEVIAIPLAIGFLNAIRAISLMIGTAILSKFTNNHTLGYIFVANGIMIIIWGYLSSNFYLSLFGSFISGFFTTTLWSYSYTLLQNYTDKNFYGRVVSYNDMFFTIVSASSSILIGHLSSNGLRINFIIYIIGSIFLVLFWYYKFIIKKYNL